MLTRVRWTEGAGEACCLEKRLANVLAFLDRNNVEPEEDRPASSGE